MNGEADAKKLQQILAPYRATGNGTCKVFVRYQNGRRRCEVALGDAWRVRPDERLIGELSALADAGQRPARFRRLALKPAHRAGLAVEQAAVVQVPGS